MISSFSFSVLPLHHGPIFFPFPNIFLLQTFSYFPLGQKCIPHPSIFLLFLLRSSSALWTKYFSSVPSPFLFSFADYLFFSNESAKQTKVRIYRRFALSTRSGSKYLSHIQSLCLGTFLCISLHKKPLSMHQQVTRVMYTAARQRIMFETDKWGKTLSIPLVRAHLHPVRQSTYDQRKYENIINVWGCVVKRIVGESGSDGKLHLLQRKDKQFARKQYFFVFSGFPPLKIRHFKHQHSTSESFPRKW